MWSHETNSFGCCGLPRRDFLKAMGLMTATASLASNRLFADNLLAPATARQKKITSIKGAFVYPPTEV